MQATRVENIRQSEVKTTCRERADGGVLILIRRSFSFFPSRLPSVSLRNRILD